MTPAEMLKAKLKGWAEVNAITAAEERAKTPDQRMRELDDLYLSGKALGWKRGHSDAEIEAVRRTWMRIKRAGG